jgi:hypothetical protein
LKSRYLESFAEKGANTSRKSRTIPAANPLVETKIYRKPSWNPTKICNICNRMMLSRAELQIIELIWQATTFGPEVWHPPDSPAVEARNSHGSAQTVNLGLPIRAMSGSSSHRISGVFLMTSSPVRAGQSWHDPMWAANQVIWTAQALQVKQRRYQSCGDFPSI